MMPRFQEILEEISLMLEVSDDELTEEQKATMDTYLDELAGQEADKVDGIGQWMRLETARAEALKAEATRLSNRAKSIQNRINWLKCGYLSSMERAGVKKVRGEVYTMSVRTTDIVRIVDEAVLPEEFVKVTKTTAPDKVALKSALKEGREIPGAELAKSMTLQIS
jgi:hypothetical protein